MDGGQSTAASHYLNALFRSGTFVGLTDRELLERFGSRRSADDETAELAFAALVERHGAMVLRGLPRGAYGRGSRRRRVSSNFSCTGNARHVIRRGDSVGPWLHGVALRVAACARSRAARRQHHERRRAEMTRELTGTDHHEVDHDSSRILHEEIGRLPWRFRSALVLCYLEGLTHDKAAEQLGCPVGTIRSRLATAREKLRRQLIRRGVDPTVIPLGLSASGLPPAVESVALSISVPVSLIDNTIQGAIRLGIGKHALAGIISDEAIVLMEGVLKSMATAKLTLLTTTVLVAGLVTTGAGVAAYSGLGRDDGLTGPPSLAQAEPVRPQASPPVVQKPASRVGGPPPEVKEQLRRRSEETIRTLLREYDEQNLAERKAMQKAKTAEERKAMLMQPPRPNPASYAGALLYEAEANPGTAATEDALIWIANNLLYGSMAERAKELIASDHIQSPKIEPLFRPSQIAMSGSRRRSNCSGKRSPRTQTGRSGRSPATL